MSFIVDYFICFHPVFVLRNIVDRFQRGYWIRVNPLLFLSWVDSNYRYIGSNCVSKVCVMIIC